MAVVAVLGGSALACGYASVDGDGLAPRLLPPRDPAAATDDAGTTTPTATTTPEPDAGAADATPEAGGTPPGFCAGTSLCLTFDGDTVDRSPSALTPQTSLGITFVPGKVAQGAQFGPQSALRYAPNAAFDAVTATIEAWVKWAPGATGDGVVFDADARYSLTIRRDGTVLCKSSNADVSQDKLTADVFTHVACVFDGAKLRVYVGGAERDTDNGSIGSAPNAAAAVGGNSPSGEPFVGVIDALRVFKTARTPAEIAAAAAP